MIDDIDSGFAIAMVDTLRQQQLIRFNMVTAVTEAWTEVMLFRTKHDFRGSELLTPNYSYQRVVTESTIKGRREWRRSYRITSLAHGWSFMTVCDPAKPVSLKKMLETFRMSEHLITDMIALRVETAHVDDPEKGKLDAEQFNVHLYDPKNHFFN